MKKKLINYYFNMLNGASQISVHFHTFKECPSHNHDFYELEYIASGETICDINGDKSHLKAGDIMFLTPGNIHTCIPAEQKCEVKTVVIQFNLESLDKSLAVFNFSSQTIKGSEEISEAVDILSRECGKKADFISEFAVKNAFERVLLLSLRKMTDKENSLHISNDILRAINYINCNFTKEITLEKLCEISGYTEAYFCRLFKKTVGCTLTEYLLRLRLGSAQRMLIFTDEPVINICYSCGFGSVRNFNREFKKKFDISPKEYRQKMSKSVYN